MNETTTTDLSKFGFREIKMLSKILNAWVKHGLPNDFDNDAVVPMMNFNSGNVFLTNSNYDVAMMNCDRLESFYSCPECGHEGFKDEMEHEGNSDCLEYQECIGVKTSEVQS